MRAGSNLVSMVMMDSRKVVPRTIESSITTSVSPGFSVPRVMSYTWFTRSLRVRSEVMNVRSF